jgi:hypothetical protein
MSAAELVARLAQEGIDPTLLAQVAQELFAGEIERKALANRRENERARKAKSRDSTGRRVTARDRRGSPPPNDNISNPPPASDEAGLAAKQNHGGKQNQGGKRGTRLAEDFEAPDDWIAWAVERRGWSKSDARDEAECFARYWQAKPGREACKLDWPKTWQNWVANSRRKPGAASSTDPPKFSAVLMEEKRRREATAH